MKKYELTNKTIQHNDKTLYRIKALKDFGDVRRGDLGGYVETEDNLSHDGNCWVFDNAYVIDKAKVLGDAYVYGNAQVSENARVTGNALISGDACVRNYDEISKTEHYFNILGFKYPITVTPTSINIRCLSLTPDQLDEDVEHEDFTKDEIADIKAMVEIALNNILKNL